MSIRRQKRTLNSESKRFDWAKFKEAVAIFRFMRPYRWHFIGGMILLFLSSLVFMVFPYLAGELADVATGEGKHGLDLNQIGLILLVILFFQGLVSFFRIYLFAIVSEKGMADVRKALYGRLVTLPIFFFERNRVGDITSRITDDVNHLQTVFSITLAEFVRQILILVVGISILLVTTPELSLLMLATFPFIVIAAMIFGRFIRRLSKSRQKALADANVVVEETLQNIHTVKAFVNERFELGRYITGVNIVVKVALNMAKYRALFSTFIVIVLFGGIFFILWYGAQMVQNGQMTIGQLVAFIAYTAIIGGAIGGLGNFFTQILTAVGGTERIREILSEPAEVDDQHLPVEAIDLKGDIRFENVSFIYPSRPDVPVIRDIDLTVKQGQKIALVGQSGAGKTTIASLLLRYYPLEEGKITIGGTDISSYDVRGYRSAVGLVPQEVILFGGTIMENIKYGRPDATEEELIEAARQSHCLEFIDKFPEGFETIVGERGIKLSGGQRQRIAIARAILKDPKLLILDEATSSLDAESERLVQEALESLMAGRTSVIIAHRLATIKNVDRIFVLEHGRIVEQGTHEELSARPGGIYSALAQLQFEIHA